MSRFSHVSLLIELDHEWWWPKITTFLDTANYFPRRARTLVHESIHYWQQLSYGYLLALAQEDWEQLLAWEQGTQSAFGPLRDRYRQREGRHRFSAHDLCECVARFWEVLFVGPEVVLRDAVAEARKRSLSGDVPDELKELACQAELGLTNIRAFDMAMSISGSYGAPFAVVRELVGQSDALVIFPFFVHFALKTMRPVHFFERFLEEVTPAAVERAEALGVATSSTSWNDNLAAALYPFVSERCEEIVRQAGDGGLLHAASMYGDSSLLDNPAYLWSFQRMDSLAAVEGIAIIDMAICLPAFSDSRRLLTGFLAPPCVRFRDRQTVGLAERYAAARAGASAEEISAAEAAMTACISLQERWESFQNGLRLH